MPKNTQHILHKCARDMSKICKINVNVWKCWCSRGLSFFRSVCLINSRNWIMIWERSNIEAYLIFRQHENTYTTRVRDRISETYHARDAINRHSCNTNTSDSQSYYNVDTFARPLVQQISHRHTRIPACMQPFLRRMMTRLPLSLSRRMRRRE